MTEVSGEPAPNPEEVGGVALHRAGELDAWIDARPEDFTAWFPPAWRFVTISSPAAPEESKWKRLLGG